jgi:hypothetical protein
MKTDDYYEKQELRRGVTVLIGLAVMTAVEYFIGTSQLPNILLWVIALLKAGLVAWFFMHIYRAFSSEQGEHS